MNLDRGNDDLSAGWAVSASRKCCPIEAEVSSSESLPVRELAAR